MPFPSDLDLRGVSPRNATEARAIDRVRWCVGSARAAGASIASVRDAMNLRGLGMLSVATVLSLVAEP